MAAAPKSHSEPTCLKEWDRAFCSLRAASLQPKESAPTSVSKKLTDTIARVLLLRKRIQGQNIEILDLAQEREFITDAKEKGLLYWSEQYAMLAEEHQLQNYQLKAMQFWVGLLDYQTGSSHMAAHTQKSLSRAESYKQKLEGVIEEQKAKLTQLAIQQKEYEVALKHMQKARNKSRPTPKTVPPARENTLQLHKKSLKTKQGSMDELAIKGESAPPTVTQPRISRLQSKTPAVSIPLYSKARKVDSHRQKTNAPSVQSVLQNAKQLLEELDN